MAWRTPTGSWTWKAQVSITIVVLFGGMLLIALLSTSSDEFRYRSGHRSILEAGADRGAYFSPRVYTERLPRYEAWFTDGSPPPSTVVTSPRQDWMSAASDLLVGRGLDDDFRARYDAYFTSAGSGPTELPEQNPWELAAALVAIDDATPGDLTGGQLVAATGAVDADGTISPVVALHVKADDAAAAGAGVLFAPSAVEHRSIDIVAVTSVTEAVDWLCARGPDDAVCS